MNGIINLAHLQKILPVFSLGLIVLPSASYANADGLIGNTSIEYQHFAANETVVYNPRSLQWKAINASGTVVRTGRGSAGRAYCPDVRRSCRTPTGTYHVIAKRGADCRSSRYPVGKGGAPMPYCMFFSKYYAIHGSHDVPNKNASHGCIRVKPSDASWLYHNFVKVGTTVVVKPY